MDDPIQVDHKPPGHICPPEGYRSYNVNFTWSTAGGFKTTKYIYAFSLFDGSTKTAEFTKTERVSGAWRPTPAEIEEAIQQAPNATNKKYVAYLVTQVGRKVGSGLCQAVVDNCFSAVGQPPEDSAYDSVLLENAAPGDLLNFPAPDGASMGHVAAVFRVLQRHPSLVVEAFEQNNNGEQIVRVNKIDLSARLCSVSRVRARRDGDTWRPPLEITPPEGFRSYSYVTSWRTEGRVKTTKFVYTFVLMDGSSTHVAETQRIDRI
jgi:hypothetical protein